MTDCPPPLYSTNQELHGYDRRKRYKTKDWRVTHNAHIHLWQNRVRHPVHAGPPHDQHTFDKYLRWLHRSTKTHIKPSYTEEAIDEDLEEDVIEDVYDVTTREDTQLQRAPLQRYMATQLSRLSNEAAFRLHESRGQRPGVLAAFVEKVKKSCRKLAQKLR
ncbi:uncharacterized protein [Miscanthus floridulus]|uniref:uncharacterized protein n=1 Tax=Miscanthus floridulus TaxID=154761 RepID=UPI003459FD74